LMYRDPVTMITLLIRRCIAVREYKSKVGICAPQQPFNQDQNGSQNNKIAAHLIWWDQVATT